MDRVKEFSNSFFVSTAPDSEICLWDFVSDRGREIIGQGQEPHQFGLQLLQFSSVQFKMVSMRSEKPIVIKLSLIHI